VIVLAIASACTYFSLFISENTTHFQICQSLPVLRRVIDFCASLSLSLHWLQTLPQLLRAWHTDGLHSESTVKAHGYVMLDDDDDDADADDDDDDKSDISFTIIFSFHFLGLSLFLHYYFISFLQPGRDVAAWSVLHRLADAARPVAAACARLHPPAACRGAGLARADCGGKRRSRCQGKGEWCTQIAISNV
jgi:hypothetical protein